MFNEKLGLKLKKLSEHNKKNSMTVQRWTDEMLDELASSLAEQRDSVNTLRDSVNTQRDSINTLRDSVNTQRDGLDTVQDSIDGLRVTAQALLQVAAQHQQEMELMKERHQQEIELMKQRQAENDARFNTLLEEVRYLIRRDDRLDTPEN